MRAAMRAKRGQVRLTAGQDEHGEPSGREAERPHPLRVQPVVAAPSLQHVVGQDLQLAGAVLQVRRSAGVPPAVAGVGHRGRDEARFSERLGGVEMPRVGTAVAMGDHDQRQATSPDRSIGGDGLGVEFQRLRGAGSRGRIPDAGLQGRAALRIRNAEALEAHPGVRDHGYDHRDEGGGEKAEGAAHERLLVRVASLIPRRAGSRHRRFANGRAGSRLGEPVSRLAHGAIARPCEAER